MLKHIILKLLKTEHFIVLLGGFSILPFLILVFYNHPAADDFCYHFQSYKLGFLESQWHWYTHWTGRYFATFMLSLEPIVTGSFIWYKLIPIVLLLLFFISVYLLSSKLFKNLTIKALLCITSLIFITYIIQMPSVVQGFFWMPGSISYVLPCILSIFLITGIMRLIYEPKWSYLLISILLGFIIIGCNETSMLMIDFLIGLIVVYRFYVDQRINRYLLILMLSFILFSLIVIYSPGNAERASNFSNSQDFFNTVLQTSLAVKKYVLHWLTIILLMILLFFGYFSSLSDTVTSRLFNVSPMLVFWIAIILPFIGFFPGYWTLGGAPPLRTINTIYFFFLIGVVYFFMTLFFKFKTNNTNFIKFSNGVNYLLIVMVCLFFIKSNNVKMAYYDLLGGEAYTYDLELKLRYNTIKTSTQDTIYVMPLQTKPTSLYFDDITQDSKDWRNRCYDNYYNHTIIIRD
ncbi:hypothetical protein OE09_2124 [Flavobacteriaceae bacterium MAR_2010_72]|nr:hypothetical protein OE09_2124 [Flavobacteriaceae bacterium MAR_2010_72]